MTRLVRLAAAFAIGLTVHAASAQSARPTPPDLGARLDRIASALDLSAEQRAALAPIGERYDAADRPALWQAAADVEAVLTDAQVEALRSRAQARRADRDGDRTQRRERGGDRVRRDGLSRRGGAGPARGRQGDRAGRPTDAQREAVREVRESYRERFESLRASFQAGRLSAEAFVRQRRALRESMEADLRAGLPAETVARLDARDARREAEREARARALDLTAEQQAAFKALAARRLRDAADRPARGERPTAQEREAMRERRESARDAAQEILTTDQRDVITLHRALAGSRGRRGRGGHRGAARRGAPHDSTPLAPSGAALQTVPTALAVDAIAPNPAAGRVRLAYAVPEGGAVRVEVFDVRGRRVLEQFVQAPGAGRYDLALGVADLVPGVYVARVTSGGAQAEARFTVAR